MPVSESTSPVHPYIPNSVPAVEEAMLAEIGAASVDELYGAIPERLRLGRTLELGEPLQSEYELRRHMEEVLGRNRSCAGQLSFLGGGCWQHYVPAVVDEVVNRGEFVTAYYGDTYGDHGKLQALFEYASMMGELVELDAVSMPTYDWGTAAATSLCMAARLTGRGVALVPRSTAPERLAIIEQYCKPWVEIELLPFDAATGLLELDAVRAALSADAACVYVENPGYLGTIETQAEEVASLARDAGAMSVVGVDPSSLGVLAPPPQYGADIVCGDLQPLGVHMHFGGGLAGFVATPDDERHIAEYPTFLLGLAPTDVEGEFAFGELAWERISYVTRADSKEYAGTTQNLWAIAAAVYLALVGPNGLAELGQGIAKRARYAAEKLDAIEGVRAPALDAPFFKEFVVNFDGTGQTVAAVNRALREQGIFGGKDLSREFPDLGQSALYCVTEVHSKADIDRVTDALEGIVGRERKERR